MTYRWVTGNLVQVVAGAGRLSSAIAFQHTPNFVLGAEYGEAVKEIERRVPTSVRADIGSAKHRCEAVTGSRVRFAGGPRARRRHEPGARLR